MKKRIYVDGDFAKKLKIKAAVDDKSVVDFTKNLDILIDDSKKNYNRYCKKKKDNRGGWIDL